MLRIETGLILLALLIAWLRPTLGATWFERVEHRLAKLANRRALSVALIGALALILRLAVLPIEPIPEPIVHDEFGYLLAADTFAHGRLTNPTPPMWEHFETFSILMKPTYQCFAQPGQGMMLALGEVVFGHPFWGVWLSCGLMCAAITWMLQGWLGPEWALLGGFLTVLRYGVFGYWADSYWGGAVGAIGGALVLGALPRIKQSQRVRDAVIMGIGLAILANTRPFEGFVFSLPVSVILIVWLFNRSSPSFRVSLPRVVAPLVLMLAVTAGGLGYYFWRVTGSPVRMPYQVEQKTYAVAPYMAWQSMHPKPTYNNPVIEKMYTEEAVGVFKFSRTAAGMLLKFYLGWNFFLGPAFTAPFLIAVFALPSNFGVRQMSSAALSLLMFLFCSIIAWSVESFYNPHYSAPATCVVIGILLVCLRALRCWSAGGLSAVRNMLLAVTASFILCVGAPFVGIPVKQFFIFSCLQKPEPSFGRKKVSEELEHTPGQHLVIVSYDQDHKPFDEWVYNEPKIQDAKVIWARELGDHRDTELVQYFADRTAWILHADSPELKLLPYSAHD